MSKNKIIFFTRNKPDDTLAQYQRIKKLMSLFEKTFNKEVVLFNAYDEKLSHTQLILQTKKKVKAYLKNLKDADTFVIDNLDPWSIKVLNRYAIKRNIKVYIDIVEYADPKEKRFGFISPSLYINHKTIKKAVKKNMTVIAISSFFVDFYKKKHINTVLIPNLIDEEIDKAKYLSRRIDKKVHFIFAGYPQKKDALDVTMLAMISLHKLHKDQFSFHIAGIEEEAFFDKYKKLNKYKKEIKTFTAFHGYVKHEAIKSLYLSSDFSIIMRDPKLLVCQSGFPTKFTESLSYARPVIANFTSDIDNYLTDGKNGYVVKGFDKDSLLEALKKAIKNKDNRKEMFVNALDTAKSFFSLNGFIERLKETDAQE